MQGYVFQHVSSNQSGLITLAGLQRLTRYLLIDCYQTYLQKMAARERAGSSPGKSPRTKLAFSLRQEPAYDLYVLTFTCPTLPHPIHMVSFHLLQTLPCDAKITLHFFILFIFFLKFSQDTEECCP